jgi:hypothetical protein
MDAFIVVESVIMDNKLPKGQSARIGKDDRIIKT